MVWREVRGVGCYNTYIASRISCVVREPFRVKIYFKRKAFSCVSACSEVFRSGTSSVAGVRQLVPKKKKTALLLRASNVVAFSRCSISIKHRIATLCFGVHDRGENWSTKFPTLIFCGTARTAQSKMHERSKKKKTVPKH